MIYQFSKISRDVRVAIDENKSSEQLIADEDVDTLSLDEIVHSKIEEAARKVVSEAPLYLLDGGKPFGDAIYWRDKGSGWILLPDDFMRLLIFKMSDWERAVFEPIQADSALYELQHSRYKGLRGNVQKPVVAIVRRAEGQALEFYSCSDPEAEIEQAVYIPLPKMDENGGINIPERCYRATIYLAASLSLATIGNALSQTMLELSKESLI